MENGKGAARALFSVTSFMYIDTGRTLCNVYQLSVVTFMTRLRKLQLLIFLASCYTKTNAQQLVMTSNLMVSRTYLVSVTFFLKGSNLTSIFFTGFKFINRSCFAIALPMPPDLFKVPENLTDIF